MSDKPPKKNDAKRKKEGKPLPPTPESGQEWRIVDNPQGRTAEESQNRAAEKSRPGERASHSGQYVSASPTKPVKQPRQPQRSQSQRDVVRGKLMQAGVLATDLGIRRDLTPVSDEELERTGDMRPDARPSEDLVNDDRGR